ncbi:hypothetical protein M422DRAFT_74674 [Sphaerobolus stellatus SS14]|nr:hypothetical protein M422DRAFT_74674 [Sphaerobolus stellatus SS14]
MSTEVETAQEIIQPLFTCMSCSIGFLTAEDQRSHYRSDHHRYNMKRRVAGLPPITPEIFNQKILQRRAETMVTTSPKGATCEVCNKVYTTENAYRSHIISKKHKENELKASLRPKAEPSQTVGSAEEAVYQTTEPAEEAPEAPSPSKEIASSIPEAEAPSPTPEAGVSTVDEAAEEEEGDEEDDIMRSIDAKIAAARSRLTPNSCLFCTHQSSTLDDCLTHMASQHSFFIPDIEYLEDINALLTYLGEKVAVGNVCLYCNGKGREFRTVEAVRKHMIDKGHCKIAYDSEKDRLEISDYYDFSSSYPDAVKFAKRASKSKKAKSVVTEKEDGEWQDVENDGEEADEVIEEEESSDEDDLPDNQITYGDTEYELVLPSGARIGHRSLRHYYAQSFSTHFPSAKEDPKSGAAIVRKLMSDKRSDLVPVKGGFGAFGTGTQVIKARNRGEAREAGRHIREFRDQKRREDFKTKVGFIHNSQKHFRDPLLQ